MQTNIKSERARLDMTQHELAEKIGVHVSSIGRWEQDGSSVPCHVAAAMSELFGCSVDYLFCLTDKRN